MKLAPRETMLLVATGAVGLFAGTALLVKPRYQELKECRLARAQLVSETDHDKALVAQRERWAGEFAELSGMLPAYSAGKKMEVHWLSFMDTLAARHGVKIHKRQAGTEKRIGDVYELPVECRDWEGGLDAIVRFLFELQKEGAMLDIRQLLVKSKGKGVLRGRFSLYCAYTREEGGEDG